MVSWAASMHRSESTGEVPVEEAGRGSGKTGSAAGTASGASDVECLAARARRGVPGEA